MAPVYADHPFALIETPMVKLPEGSKPTMFHDVAANMALAHSMFLRGLNSVYLQAPHVAPRDQASFVQWMLLWYKGLHLHHEGEEAHFFPDIEKAAGEEGIMAANVEQHHAFAEGLTALHTYAEDCASGKEKYDGARVVAIIDSFGALLREHLNQEIDTLMGLQKYGHEKMKDLPELIGREASENMKALGLWTGLPACVFCIDMDYEGGRWAQWPPAPPGLIWFVKNISSRWHEDWYKFAPVDRQGHMRSLYAVGEA